MLNCYREELLLELLGKSLREKENTAVVAPSIFNVFIVSGVVILNTFILLRKPLSSISILLNSKFRFLKRRKLSINASASMILSNVRLSILKVSGLWLHDAINTFIALLIRTLPISNVLTFAKSSLLCNLEKSKSFSKDILPYNDTVLISVFDKSVVRISINRFVIFVCVNTQYGRFASSQGR